MISTGAVLLLPVVDAVFGRPSELKPGAFQPIFSIPLKEVYERRKLTAHLRLPSDEEIGASDLNELRYIVIASAYEGLAHCWNDVGIIVSAEAANRRLAILNAQGAPYSWSARCALSGVWFSASESERIKLTIEAGAASQLSGDLVVLPFVSGVKDRLVGSMIHRDVVMLSWFTTPIGMLLIAAALVSFRSNKERN